MTPTAPLALDASRLTPNCALCSRLIDHRTCTIVRLSDQGWITDRRLRDGDGLPDAEQ